MSALGPDLGVLRLARISDIPRIGIVAAAGFYHSPVFQYQRPYHNEFVNDTVSSYKGEYLGSILDPNSIVLVVEDTIDQKEADHVYGALAKVYPPFEDQVPSDSLKAGKAIVGVASVSLQPGSKRAGKCQPEGQHPTPPNIEVGTRDQSSEGNRLYKEATGALKAKLFKDRMLFSTVVIHPAYWRRGHGREFASWITRLADEDQAPMGVSATPMGKLLVQNFGFDDGETVRIEGYEGHKEPFSIFLGLRKAGTIKAEL